MVIVQTSFPFLLTPFLHDLYYNIGHLHYSFDERTIYMHWSLHSFFNMSFVEAKEEKGFILLYILQNVIHPTNMSWNISLVAVLPLFLFFYKPYIQKSPETT